MELIGKFLWYYLSAGFWGAHAVVWLIAIWVLVEHRHELKTLLLQANNDDSHDAVRAAQRTEEAERRNTVYDLCSSVFILIGLLGTIWGFYKGMIQASAGRVPLDEIAPALSTSAFGIIWAVVLNFLVMYAIEPHIEDIKRAHRERVSTTSGIATALEAIGTKLDGSLMVVKETVEAINKELKAVFESGTKSFTDASLDIASAATGLKESVRSSSESFKQSIAEASQTAKKLDSVLKAAMSLPEKVGAQLEQYAAAEAQRRDAFFRQVSGSFHDAVEIIAKQLLAMEQIPAAVRGEIVATQNIYVDQMTALTGSIAGYGGKLETSLADLYETHEALLSSATAKVRDEFNTLLTRMALHVDLISQLPERLRSEFDVSHNTYSETVNQALHDFREFEQLAESRIKNLLLTYQQALETSASEANHRTATVTDAFAKVADTLEALPGTVGESSRKLTDEYLELLRQQQAADLARLAAEIDKVWKKAHGEMEAVRQKVESVTTGLTEVGGAVYREQQQKVSEEVKLLFFQMNQFVNRIHTTIAEALSVAPGEIQAKADAIKAEVASLAVAAAAAGQQSLHFTEEVRKSVGSLDEDLRKLDPILDNFKAASEKIRTVAESSITQRSEPAGRPVFESARGYPGQMPAPGFARTSPSQLPTASAPTQPQPWNATRQAPASARDSTTQPVVGGYEDPRNITQGFGGPPGQGPSSEVPALKTKNASTVASEQASTGPSDTSWLRRAIGHIPFVRRRR